MNTENSCHLMIFCDGGIGNRINSLTSGLALARHFNLDYCIYWPENNWCQAGFYDIFQNHHPVSKLSIKDLKGTLNDATVMLHDEIASESLDVTFNSAYQYSTLDEFLNQVISNSKRIFFYPAIIPQWITSELILDEIKKLKFSNFIQNEVKKFIEDTLRIPFYGLHLRRTDLNVGLNDHEVLDLVTQHPKETFFVCSDDPIAEALASAHPNVHKRTKLHNIEKKYSSDHWLAQSLDDDGRLYYGNIQRSKEAVIEGTIDLLILGHSQIIGYSGSTFQRMAKIIGETNPIININKPTEIVYYSTEEIKKSVSLGLISEVELVNICNILGANGKSQQAIEIFHQAIEYFDGSSLHEILHALSIFSLNQNRPRLASIYLKYIHHENTARYSSLLHLSYAKLKIDKHIESNFYYEKSKFFKPENLNEADRNLDVFMKNNLEGTKNGI